MLTQPQRTNILRRFLAQESIAAISHSTDLTASVVEHVLRKKLASLTRAQLPIEAFRRNLAALAKIQEIEEVPVVRSCVHRP